MKEFLKDKEHLVRVAGLFLAGFLVFLIARAAFVPRDFGEYGHYRAGALQDNMDRPLSFAGQAACEGCHSEVVEARAGSLHEGIACEACHDPQEKHANSDDPAKDKPKRPNPKTICLVCHMENVAKPAKFPQVNPKEHGDGQACSSCHRPHHPEVSAEPPGPPPAAASLAPSKPSRSEVSP